MKGKNPITIVLMISSLGLLVILQAFWLKSSYEKAFFDLRGKLDFVFRESVTNLRDSILLKGLERIPDDSLHKHEKQFTFVQRVDTSMVSVKKGTNGRSSQIQIFISNSKGSDSLKSTLGPIVSKIGDGSLPGTRYVFNADVDSLSLDSIEVHYKRGLQKAGLPVSVNIIKNVVAPPFSIPENRSRDVFVARRRNNDDQDHSPVIVFGDKIQTQWVRTSPFNRYSAQIVGIRPIIVREIIPQIFFSGILTSVTVLAFVFMFRSIRSQQRLMMLKNDFISNVTHELKTPIATVSVALEALKNFKGIDNPKLTEEYLGIAQYELSRLSILADKVLTTSLFDEHGVKIEFEKVDLDKTLDEILRSQKLIFEKQKATVELKKSGENFTMEGNQIHLTNVIYNLLDNALKYSPGNPSITISLMDEGSNLVLSVSDKGLGIPHEFQDKVFEKFFRMPTGDVHNIKGHGLGLSYVNSVVKSHKGKITLTSLPGEGSTFTLTFPRTQ